MMHGLTNFEYMKCCLRSTVHKSASVEGLSAENAARDGSSVSNCERTLHYFSITLN